MKGDLHFIRSVEEYKDVIALELSEEAGSNFLLIYSEFYRDWDLDAEIVMAKTMINMPKKSKQIYFDTANVASARENSTKGVYPLLEQEEDGP